MVESQSPQTVLEEADSLINGARQQQYGDASENFAQVAKVWSTYLGIPVTAVDFVNLMTMLKVMRARNGYHRDSYVDICGYAALAEKVDAASTPEPEPKVDSWADWLPNLLAGADLTLPPYSWLDALAPLKPEPAPEPREFPVLAGIGGEVIDAVWRDNYGHLWRWNAELHSSAINFSWEYKWETKAITRWAHAEPSELCGPYTEVLGSTELLPT